jgi:hypothetical protein
VRPHVFSSRVSPGEERSLGDLSPGETFVDLTPWEERSPGDLSQDVREEQGREARKLFRLSRKPHEAN